MNAEPTGYPHETRVSCAGIRQAAIREVFGHGTRRFSGTRPETVTGASRAGNERQGPSAAGKTIVT
jgi:hypothetical protein